jgi:pimeloyl-ACP methyl ester carboxylesterase
MKDIAFREPQLNYWISNWNNPKVVRLSDVGHYPQEEAPKEVIKALQDSR